MVVRICAVALNLEYGHTDLRQVPPTQHRELSDRARRSLAHSGSQSLEINLPIVLRRGSGTRRRPLPIHGCAGGVVERKARSQLSDTADGGAKLRSRGLRPIRSVYDIVASGLEGWHVRTQAHGRAWGNGPAPKNILYRALFRHARAVVSVSSPPA